MSARIGRRDVTLVVGLVILVILAAAAILSAFWTPFALDDTSGGRLAPPGGAHLLGTDRLGRDLFSQVLAGTRIAILVGIGSVALAAVIGFVIGTTAALLPGWVDDAVSSFLDVLIAFPTLLLAMLIVAARGPGLDTAIVAIGIAGSAIVSRFTRILVKGVLSQSFVTAARTSGAPTLGVLARHVLPNIWPALAVNLAVLFGAAIMAEASLSYLGLGVPPPNSSLGRLLQEAQSTVLTSPWGAVIPGIVIALLVLGANAVADGLRERFDPTRRGRS
ncbi:ABC transporter permease [Microbacterium sp. Au-Mic1]|uniref:ABC transporter permease n=1 Tax=Microbacterium sp. Au-Mic1 TaxID=2906457 RepID=UPI001E5EB380|nr:ABC transporter permease [Microbacterium sp. Au-Mic1]MCE4025040.1 ABC transporter permease [Microbacterium sp. Au-Mic1]